MRGFPQALVWEAGGGVKLGTFDEAFALETKAGIVALAAYAEAGRAIWIVFFLPFFCGAIFTG